MRGHSTSKQNNFVTDNIGNFQNIIFRFGIDYDTTNDFSAKNQVNIIFKHCF